MKIYVYATESKYGLSIRAAATLESLEEVVEADFPDHQDLSTWETIKIDTPEITVYAVKEYGNTLAIFTDIHHASLDAKARQSYGDSRRVTIEQIQCPGFIFKL